ncbi:hypothetical protein SAMN05421781_1362 [Marinococcus luteus]|uniref:Zinc-or iron-chelating domain-containing protein n=1 Tax=Marinococcus luteus TaxID=1122204 RepID=A0A1H2TG42_9BACI|nr:YkgJ family cysteine cluster protein [Marinococcus luteus]SDW42234.1 hypothetical protein SAMN05421781_1362 [Marinococcus luteus]
MKYSDFPCNKCGLCCQNIQHITELQEFDDGTGTCIHLKENECTIYENRPLICRIDDMYEKVFSNRLSKQEYYEQNIIACRELQFNNEVAEEDILPLNLIKGEEP